MAVLTTMMHKRIQLPMPSILLQHERLVRLLVCGAVAMLLTTGVYADNDSHKPDRDQHRHTRSLDKEQLKHAIEIIHVLKPELAERIKDAARKNPEKITQVIVHGYPPIRHLLRLRRADRQLFDLKINEMRLARESDLLMAKLRQAQDAQNDPAIDQTAKKIADVVKQQFETRQAIREHEIARLELRIKQLRARLQETTETKQTLIAQRLKRMLGPLAEITGVVVVQNDDDDADDSGEVHKHALPEVPDDIGDPADE